MKNVQKKRRVEWIDTAKGIGILLVLFSHIMAAYARRANDQEILSSTSVLIVGSFFMPLFFYLSGIFIQSSLNKSFVTVIKQKFMRLMVPYFVWGIIFVILWGVYSQHNPVFRIFELPIRPIFVLWFLYSMFLSILLFCLLQKRLSKSMVFMLSITLYVVGYIGGEFFSIDSFLKPLVGLCQNFVFLDLGFLLKDRIIEKNNTFVELGIAFFCLGMLLLLNLYAFDNYFLKLIVNFIRSVLGILCVCEFSKVLDSLFSKIDILATLGFYSMQIYLIHKPVIEVFTLIISRITMNVVLLTSLCLVFTLIVSFILIRLIDSLNGNRIFFGIY